MRPSSVVMVGVLGAFESLNTVCWAKGREICYSYPQRFFCGGPNKSGVTSEKGCFSV